MARPITTLAIFFLALNLFAGMVMATGIGGMLGLETDLGGDEEVDDAVRESGNVSSGAPTGSTLFGMYNVLAGLLSTLAAPITAGPTMLRQAGVPEAITNSFLTPLISVVYAIGIISFLRGWGL